MENKVEYKGLTCIYMITNPKGKIYIGQTQNLWNRINKYRYNKAKGQQKLNRSIVKYGLENHTISVLKVCELDGIDELECQMIKKYNTVKQGLNIRQGGGSKARGNGMFFSKKEEKDAKQAFLDIYKKMHSNRRQ